MTDHVWRFTILLLYRQHDCYTIFSVLTLVILIPVYITLNYKY